MSVGQQLNKFKWLLIAVLLIAGIAANTHFSQVALALRAAAGLVLVMVVLGIAYTTSQGQRAFAFMKGSRAELRKVVWPTRQETVQTTLVVVAMVVVTAIILWGLDSFFIWLLGLLTGQRG